MKRNYIGIANSMHDGAIAIVDATGQLVFAEATERALQQKRAVNVAADLFWQVRRLIDAYCEPGAEIVLATSWSDHALADTQALMLENSSEQLLQQMAQLLGEVPPFVRRRYSTLDFLNKSLAQSLSNVGRTLEWELQQSERWFKTRIVRRYYPHHLTHASTACFSSPFDDAACAVIDGYGEGAAVSYFRYQDGQIRELKAGGKGSLGVFFSDVCDACGFGNMGGEEWKVMGLAAYGEHDEELYQLLRSMLRVNGLQLDFVDNFNLLRAFRKLDPLCRKKGTPTIAAANLARAGQRVFTETMMALLRALHDETGSKNLALGGGCALNSSANGQIISETGFSSLHVFSAPADDGNAIGAAMLAYQEDHPEERVRRFASPYLGSGLDDEAIENVKRFGAIPRLQTCSGDAPERAARMLADGKIVGWIQGRAEMGPRALGNRSILADPRSADIKEAINARVKFREEFRPFAPSILHEFGPAYFESYQESPYMERTLRFRDEVRSRVPGVVHQDGTGRLQTVKPEWNELYYRLIRAFHALTGIPLVLNTSFNVMGKPIAHSVEDVLAVFYTSGLDAVFIGDLLIEK